MDTHGILDEFEIKPETGNGNVFGCNIHTSCWVFRTNVSYRCRYGADLSLTHPSFLQLVPNATLPSQVLRGPWTDEKCALLETLLVEEWWLTAGGEERAMIGLKEAIREKNDRAVAILTGYTG